LGQAHVPPHSAQRFRILVAEDDEAIRNELVALFSKNYDLVGTVMNGRELVEMALVLKPQLVIADISMPELSGLEAVKQLKQQGLALKVVFFTGNENQLYLRRALQLGADGYVLKEHGMEELPIAVELVLNGGSFISPSLRTG
jgi:DNA-binding NarL/FixJ family response regulator